MATGSEAQWMCAGPRLIPRPKNAVDAGFSPRPRVDVHNALTTPRVESRAISLAPLPALSERQPLCIYDDQQIHFAGIIDFLDQLPP